MSRFRYQGVAWDGEEWRLVPSLVVLGDQISDEFPERRLVDGTVAGRQHDTNNPASDHTVKNGLVRALDAGGTYDQLWQMTEAIRLSKDPRVLYVIFNGRMFSSYSKNGIPPFTWRTYTGYSPHSHHFHISVRGENQAQIQLWDIGVELPMTDHPYTPPENLTDEEGEVFKKVWDKYRSLGIVSEHSDPIDPVETQQFIAFLDRYDRIVVGPVRKELDDLKALVASLELGSGDFDIETVSEDVLQELIRRIDLG